MDKQAMIMAAGRDYFSQTKSLKDSIEDAAKLAPENKREQARVFLAKRFATLFDANYED